MNLNESNKFSYSKPIIIDIKKQKTLGGCNDGGAFLFPSCEAGGGNASTCNPGIAVEGQLCRSGGATTSGSYCMDGTGATFT